MTLSGESNAGAYRRVLAALVERYPYGCTPAELGDAAEVHGRQLGGIVRALYGRGVIDRLDTLSRGRMYFVSEATAFVWRLVA